jgi:hypothetical protein
MKRRNKARMTNLNKNGNFFNTVLLPHIYSVGPSISLLPKKVNSTTKIKLPLLAECCMFPVRLWILVKQKTGRDAGISSPASMERIFFKILTDDSDEDHEAENE